MSDDIEIIRESANVFRHLDHPDADREQLRALLAARIMGVLDDRKLTVRSACERTGRLPPRVRRPRLVAVLGALALVLGCVLLVMPTPERGVWCATAGSLVIGVGMGLSNSAYLVSIQAVACDHRGGDFFLFVSTVRGAVGGDGLVRGRAQTDAAAASA